MAASKGRIVELRDRSGGAFRTYVSGPARPKAPAVVVGIDIFGLRELFFDIADLFAEKGYLTLVPDYFWDVQRNPGGDYRGVYKFDTMTEVTRATMESARAMPECNGRVAAMGYCVGGNTAFVAAARFGADAAATYYGTRIHTLLDEVDAVSCPTVLHLAEHDETYSDEARDKILATIVRNPRIAAHIYPARHGFASTHVDQAARDLANERTWALFSRLAT